MLRALNCDFVDLHQVSSLQSLESEIFNQIIAGIVADGFKEVGVCIYRNIELV